MTTRRDFLLFPVVSPVQEMRTSLSIGTQDYKNRGRTLFLDDPLQNKVWL